MVHTVTIWEIQRISKVFPRKVTWILKIPWKYCHHYENMVIILENLIWDWNDETHDLSKYKNSQHRHNESMWLLHEILSWRTVKYIGEIEISKKKKTGKKYHHIILHVSHHAWNLPISINTEVSTSKPYVFPSLIMTRTIPVWIWEELRTKVPY